MESRLENVFYVIPSSPDPYSLLNFDYLELFSINIPRMKKIETYVSTSALCKL